MWVIDKNTSGGGSGECREHGYLYERRVSALFPNVFQFLRFCTRTNDLLAIVYKRRGEPDNTEFSSPEAAMAH